MLESEVKEKNVAPTKRRATRPDYQVGGVMIQIALTVAGPGFRYQCGVVLR